MTHIIALEYDFTLSIWPRQNHSLRIWLRTWRGTRKGARSGEYLYTLLCMSRKEEGHALICIYSSLMSEENGMADFGNFCYQVPFTHVVSGHVLDSAFHGDLMVDDDYTLVVTCSCFKT